MQPSRGGPERRCSPSSASRRQGVSSRAERAALRKRVGPRARWSLGLLRARARPHFDHAQDDASQVMAVRPLLSTPVEQVKICTLCLELRRCLASFHDSNRESSTSKARRRSKTRRPTSGNHHIHSTCLNVCGGSNGLQLCSIDAERWSHTRCAQVSRQGNEVKEHRAVGGVGVARGEAVRTSLFV